jgi:hypothetical protein
MPKTRANASCDIVDNFQYLPGSRGSSIALHASAFDALAWVTRKFQGWFANKGVNKAWRKKLALEGNDREEAIRGQTRPDEASTCTRCMRTRATLMRRT